uniref:PhoPQ-activated pathogenicity-related family protein n=1 Tax=Arhodomonas sp. AD133 TaxID=3415009 RepID=UPI003EBC007E
MTNRLLSLAGACIALMSINTLAAAPTAERALSDYVDTPDESYRWEVKRRGTLLGVDYALLHLVSQRWQGTTWRHQLWLIDPTDGAGDRHALLFISGGRWPRQGEPSTELPSDAPLFAAIARRMNAPVAVLRHVPFQPLFDGLTEDELIAATFARFLRSPREAQWPALLPMVNSAIRAMDAVQAFSREWAQPIETFTVTGASKRGWTTWLTAAVDERVRALAPMVFDVLNMGPQLRHQREVWGELSPKLHDYVALGLDRQLDTEAGRKLQSIVDPYHYRGSITQPKLVVLGTNDDYWPVDALNLYWTELAEPRYVLYLPNQGHHLRDYARLLPTLDAFHRHIARGLPLPELDWTFARQAGALTLRVTAKPTPVNARVWSARASKRDFREVHWVASPMHRRDGAYLSRLGWSYTNFRNNSGRSRCHALRVC